MNLLLEQDDVHIPTCHIEYPKWKAAACSRNKCKRTIQEGIKVYQKHTISWANVKCAVRKWEIVDRAIYQIICDECSRIYLFNTGIASHKKSHICRFCEKTINIILGRTYGVC